MYFLSTPTYCCVIVLMLDNNQTCGLFDVTAELSGHILYFHHELKKTDTVYLVDSKDTPRASSGTCIIVTRVT